MHIDDVLKKLDEILDGSLERDFLVERRVRSLSNSEEILQDIRVRLIEAYVLENCISSEVKKSLGLKENPGGITPEQEESILSDMQILDRASFEQLQNVYRALLNSIEYRKKFYAAIKEK